MEAETGVVQPHAKDAGSFRSWKRQEGASPSTLRGSKALPTPAFQTSGLRMHFCCLKLPSVFSCVPATKAACRARAAHPGNVLLQPRELAVREGARLRRQLGLTGQPPPQSHVSSDYSLNLHFHRTQAEEQPP